MMLAMLCIARRGGEEHLLSLMFKTMSAKRE